MGLNKISFCSFLCSQRVLGITKGMEDLGGMQWELFGTLVLGWIIVYLIIMKGIQSSGYVVYFTAGFPYIVLFIFLIRGVTLPGAWAGIKHMFWPKVSNNVMTTEKIMIKRSELTKV